MQADAPGLRVLDWDSRFFGNRIARVFPGEGDSALGSQVELADQLGLECLYLLCPLEEQGLFMTAQRLGFVSVDVRVTLQLDLAVSKRLFAPAAGIRPFAAEDKDSLRRLAAHLHQDTRFYADPRFQRSRCDDLYSHWIERDVSSHAWRCWVVVADDGPAGYGTLSIEAKEAFIGLFGLRSDLRGRGLGSALLATLIDNAASHGCASVQVVTQGRNIAAQRLYQKSGFRTHDMAHWLHRWAPAST